MYAKCGSLQDARRVFATLPQRDVVTWNAIIAGYAQQGMGHKALSRYSGMQKESSLDLKLHEQIAERGLHNDVVLAGSLVNMYAKCGSLKDARTVFDGLHDRNVVTWTSTIASYAQQGMGQEALYLYDSMPQEGLAPPDSVTLVCLLQACASVGAGALHQGKQLHAQVEERGLQDDVVLGGSLVSMYGKCGSAEDGRRVFDRLPDRNVVTWNAMLAGYVQQGIAEEALNLYSHMQQGFTPPDSVTFVWLLQACASVGAQALHQGKQLHAQIEERRLQDDVVLGTCLIDMYVKRGSIEDSPILFDRLPDRNVVTWTARIAGYAELMPPWGLCSCSSSASGKAASCTD